MFECRVLLYLTVHGCLCGVVMIYRLCCLVYVIMCLISMFQVYGWVVSLGFMNTTAAACWCTVIFLCGFCAIALHYGTNSFFHPLLTPPAVSNKHGDGEAEAELKVTAMDRPSNYIYKIALFVFCNVVVVIVANGSYVYVLLSANTAVQAIFTVLLGLFKTTWNNVVVYPLLGRLRSSQFLIINLLVFNNIIVPIIATALVDVDCFQSFFISSAPIDTDYIIRQYECDVGRSGDRCGFVPTLLTVSFKPPFVYSGQCSSAILTNYVPIYVLMYGVVGIIVPLMQLIALYCINNYPGVRNSLCGMRGSRMAKFLSGGVLVPMIYPINSTTELDAKYGYDSSDSGGDGSGGDGSNKIPVKSTPLYGLKQNVTNMVLSLFVVVTFGLAYPPLAVIILLAIFLRMLSIQSCMHSHMIQLMSIESVDKPESGKDGLSVWHRIIDHDLSDLEYMLYDGKSHRWAYILSCIFVCGFILDMVYTLNVVAEIVLPCVIVLVACGILWYQHTNTVLSVIHIKLPSVPEWPAPSFSSNIDPSHHIEMRDSTTSNVNMTATSTGSNIIYNRSTLTDNPMIENPMLKQSLLK